MTQELDKEFLDELFEAGIKIIEITDLRTNQKEYGAMNLRNNKIELRSPELDNAFRADLGEKVELFIHNN